MKKIIKIGDKEIEFAANAALTFYYRKIFKKDFIVDFQKLTEGLQKKDNTLDFEVIENMAYTMAKLANKDITDDVGEWLAQFEDPFAIYSAMNEIVEVWNANKITTSKPKKK